MKTLAEIRNPVLALPAARRLLELDPASRSALRAVLLDVAVAANANAELSWKKRKGPMAAYWRAVSTYSKHIARATRDQAPDRTGRKETPR